jgi:RecA-family ATPase
MDLGQGTKPLPLVPISSWAHAPEPPPRDWIWEGLIPAGKVTSLLGNGGTGKTLLALQIGLHVAMGRPLFNVPIKGGPVLGIFCEDDVDELRRRLASACAAERIDMEEASGLIAMSREGEDSVLCEFKRDHIRLTRFHSELEATVAALKPRLLILDTAADLFAGDFLSTPHVRQFLKIALGGICKRHSCGILLLAHPSASAMASGDGGGFSTAWNNSVRSRLYLRTQRATGDEPKSNEELGDQRIIELKKTNYGPPDKKIPVRWQSGCFVFDIEPIEGLEQKGARVKTTRVSVAAYDFIRARYPLSLGFREIFDALRDRGDIPEGDYDERRKPLSRALRELTAEGLIEAVSTPRGHYRAKAST